jgi:hypothetical protein
MRTPFRLAATLLQTRFSEIVGRGNTLAMCCVAPQERGAEQSPVQRKATRGGDAPVCWLSEPGEPLANPSVGKLTRALQDAGRTVFLETDGTLLRRRIHEFRPDARLYLTVRLYGMRDSHDSRMERDDAFALAMEGVRAAQLAGFLICAYIPVDGETSLEEVKLLLEHLRKAHVEGVVITSTNRAAAAAEELQKKVTEARNLIGHAWWMAFSRLAERTLNTARHPVFVGTPHVATETSRNAELHSVQGGAGISEEVAVP